MTVTSVTSFLVPPTDMAIVILAGGASDAL
jgi:hypothetical protein